MSRRTKIDDIIGQSAKNERKLKNESSPNCIVAIENLQQRYLPATALAFAPQQPVSLFPTSRVSNVALRDVRGDVDDAVKKIEDTTEDYVGKADELVISRGMRFANHLPVLVTLKALADKAGMSASLNGGIVAVSSQLLQYNLAMIHFLVCVRSLHFGQ